MDGVVVERPSRRLKHERIHLRSFETGSALRAAPAGMDRPLQPPSASFGPGRHDEDPRPVRDMGTASVGMEHLDRDIAVDAGLAGALLFGPGTAGIEAPTDISDTHDGGAVRATFGTSFAPTPRLGVAPQARATCSDGLRTEEARGGIAAHAMGNTIIPSPGIRSSCAVTDRRSLTAGVSIELPPGEATESPIVKRDALTSVFFGIRSEFRGRRAGDGRCRRSGRGRHPASASGLCGL